jgi:hypothetical protein
MKAQNLASSVARYHLLPWDARHCCKSTEDPCATAENRGRPRSAQIQASTSRLRQNQFQEGRARFCVAHAQ